MKDSKGRKDNCRDADRHNQGEPLLGSFPLTSCTPENEIKKRTASDGLDRLSPGAIDRAEIVGGSDEPRKAAECAETRVLSSPGGRTDTAPPAPCRPPPGFINNLYNVIFYYAYLGGVCVSKKKRFVG